LCRSIIMCPPSRHVVPHHRDPPYDAIDATPHHLLMPPTNICYKMMLWGGTTTPTAPPSSHLGEILCSRAMARVLVVVSPWGKTREWKLCNTQLWTHRTSSN
jgi:hypothetical protein